MANLTDNLLSWYKKNKRKFPWRIKKNIENPYYVWISEIMLQQTNANSVSDHYKKFISKWPNIVSLSKARLHSVLLLWQGLGYYRRAINLHNTAKIICKKFNGEIPNNYNNLIKLPGIGDYTANAIMSIGFNKNTIGIDVNIARVISRLYSLDINNHKKISKQLHKLLPINHSRNFMQALMDLGAKICQKKKVDCIICPLRKYCHFHNKNRTTFELEI